MSAVYKQSSLVEVNDRPTFADVSRHVIFLVVIVTALRDCYCRMDTAIINQITGASNGVKKCSRF